MLVSVKRAKISPKITHLYWGASNTTWLQLNMIAGVHDLHLIMCFINVHEICLSFLRISHVFVRSPRKWKSICLLFSVFLISGYLSAGALCIHPLACLASTAGLAWHKARDSVPGMGRLEALRAGLPQPSGYIPLDRTLLLWSWLGIARRCGWYIWCDLIATLNLEWILGRFTVYHRFMVSLCDRKWWGFTWFPFDWRG